jgi:hypothetical protein
MRFLFLSLFLMASARIGFSADLLGTIKQTSGEPIAGATINISTARMRSGDSPVCPSCWADCRKSARTDARGSFRISDVSDRLVFRLLVLAEGFAPKFVANTDPQKGPIAITLEPRNIGASDAKHSIRGKVIDSNGNLIVGASVDPDFSQKGLDPLALTDAKGEFLLVSANPVEGNSLIVTAEGFAPTKIKTTGSNAGPIKVVLSRGATIAGRVLEDGKPVAGVRIGAVQTSRASDDFLGPAEASTGTDGKFEIAHVPANQEMAVYGIMDSLIGKGAIPVRITKSGADGSVDDLGDLSIEKGVKIIGQLRMTDGKAFPPGTRVHVGREVAWDWQLIDVKPDGSFEVSDLPIGEGIGIRTPQNHEIQKVSGGFQIDPLNDAVKGKTSEKMPMVAIDLVEKDERTKWKERQERLFEQSNEAFFKSEKLSPAQITTFVDLNFVALETARSKTSAGKTAAPLWQAAGTEFLTMLRQKMGADVADAFVRFRQQELGREFITPAMPDADKLLTSRENEALALALGEQIYHLYMEEAPTDESLSPEKQIARLTQITERLISAGEKVLPESKRKIFREAVKKMEDQEIQEIRQQAKQ